MHQQLLGDPLKRKRASTALIHEVSREDSQNGSRVGSRQMPTRLAPNPVAVLQELFDLLEDYAPTWYTEELHERAMIALSEYQPRRIN